MRQLIAAAIRAYQIAVSPLLPGACRFTPTCSEYARQAVTLHGAWRGSWLAARRLSRCHPFGGRGFDPVPPPPDAPHGLEAGAVATDARRLEESEAEL